MEHSTTTIEKTDRGLAATAAAFVMLTKPRIIELLLITTVPSMIVAKGGMPDLWLVLVTVAGGTLAAGGANTFNMYIDRDIDRLMKRTQGRPLVTGAVSPRAALLFGFALEITAFVLFVTWVNLLAGLLAVGACLFYVFVYSLWLKRTSKQNIVIGGAAGAAPALIGWAAVTGSLALSPILLFAIIFFWTPPHFWALSLLLKNDYAEANIPMLPVVAGVTSTKIHILLYTILLIALTSLFFVMPTVGWFYLYSSLVLGLIYLGLSIYINISSSKRVILSGYIYSMIYLALLFLAMIFDVILYN
ncbi:MAG: protoheme IX farnesyltransferase [Acidimicrobiaceae bacterium]|nr:protoheme IX farnesyltransferase [Acidimicrobiaceae bacterium]